MSKPVQFLVKSYWLKYPQAVLTAMSILQVTLLFDHSLFFQNFQNTFTTSNRNCEKLKTHKYVKVYI